MKVHTLWGGLFTVIVAIALLVASPENSSAKGSRTGKKTVKKASHSVVTKQRRAKLSKKYRRPVRQTLSESEKSEIIEKINALAQAEVMPEAPSAELMPEYATDATNVALSDDLAQAAREEAEEDDVVIQIDQFFAARPGTVDVSIDPTTSRDRQTDFTLYDEVDPHVSATRSDVMQHIIDWLGTRYVFGGDSRTGIDCSAFVRQVFRSSFNVELPRTAETQADLGQKVGRNELQFGDLVYFHTANHAWISHVGIYIGEGLFANASSSKGVTVASLDSKYWQKRYLFSKRLFTNTSTAQTEIKQALMAAQIVDAQGASQMENVQEPALSN
jgi:cell wall-associated NlpC family hydrolase